jgi:Fe-S-cluster containining protein
LEKISFATLPDDAKAYFQGVYERALSRFTTVIAEHPIGPGISRAIAEARVELLQAELAPVVNSLATAGTPVACARGCRSCCTTTVPVSPDEALALVDYLKTTLDEAGFAAFATRARAADARGHGYASVERHQLKIFCPVLDPEDGSCLGHAARPVACQGYLSLSLAACEADHEDTPREIPHPVAANLITQIVDSTRTFVLSGAGLGYAELELTAALVAAIDAGDAEMQWIRGETIFANAAYTPTRPEDLARMIERP